jgi:hypothetical protein
VKLPTKKSYQAGIRTFQYLSYIELEEFFAVIFVRGTRKIIIEFLANSDLFASREIRYGIDIFWWRDPTAPVTASTTVTASDAIRSFSAHIIVIALSRENEKIAHREMNIIEADQLQ